MNNQNKWNVKDVVSISDIDDCRYVISGINPYEKTQVTLTNKDGKYITTVHESRIKFNFSALSRDIDLLSNV